MKKKSEFECLGKSINGVYVLKHKTNKEIVLTNSKKEAIQKVGEF